MDFNLNPFEGQESEHQRAAGFYENLRSPQVKQEQTERTYGNFDPYWTPPSYPGPLFPDPRARDVHFEPCPDHPCCERSIYRVNRGPGEQSTNYPTTPLVHNDLYPQSFSLRAQPQQAPGNGWHQYPPNPFPPSNGGPNSEWVMSRYMSTYEPPSQSESIASSPSSLVVDYQPRDGNDPENVDSAYRPSVLPDARGQSPDIPFYQMGKNNGFLGQRSAETSGLLTDSDLICSVCGAASSGKHYNAVTCEGCKGFFRRVVVKLTIYRCKTGRDSCLILESNRRKCCKACRFRKCLEAGMDSKLCIKGANGNKFHPYPHSQSPSQQSCASETQVKDNNGAVKSEATSEVDSGSSPGLNLGDCGHSKPKLGPSSSPDKCGGLSATGPAPPSVACSHISLISLNGPQLVNMSAPK